MRAGKSLIYLIQKGGLWLFFGHALTLLGQFALIKYLAANGSKVLFGQYSIAMLIVAALGVLFVGPLIQWVLRHYQEYYERKRLADYFKLISLVLSVSILVIISLALVFYHVLDFQASGFGQRTQSLILIFALLSCLNDLMSAVLNAASYARTAAVCYVLGSWVKVLGLFVSLEYFNGGFDAVLVSISMTQLLLLLAQVLIIKNYKLVNINNIYKLDKRLCVHFRSMKGYLLPFILWGVPSYIALMGDRWVLAAHVSIEVLAEYAAMVFVTFGVANAIGVAFNKAVGPIVFRLSGSGSDNGRRDSAKNIINGLTIVFIAGYFISVIIYYVWGAELMVLFTSVEYIASSGYLWVMMISAAVFNVSQFLITHGLVDKRPKIYLLPKVMHGFFILGLLFILVPWYGIVGAVISVFIGNVCQLIYILIVNAKQDRLRIV